MPAIVKRNWCYTAFPPTGIHLTVAEVEIACEKERAENGKCHLKYLIWQEEICPRTGQRHLQLYGEFKNPVAGSYLGRVLLRGRELERGDDGQWLRRMHHEPRRGSPEQARDYCRKEQSRHAGPFEYGTFGKGQGERSDLQVYSARIIADPNLKRVAAEFPHMVVKYPRGTELLISVAPKPKVPWSIPKIYVLLGPPGCGKTRWVYDHASEEDIYEYGMYSTGAVWFDGYEEQPVILFDEFDNDIGLPQLNKLLGGYGNRVNCKGSTKRFAGIKVVVFTSNATDLSQLWKNPDPAKLAGFERRLEEGGGGVYNFWDTNLIGLSRVPDAWPAWPLPVPRGAAQAHSPVPEVPGALPASPIPDIDWDMFID